MKTKLEKNPVPLREICTFLLAQPPCGGLSEFEREALHALRQTSFRVIEYINRNSTNGFAAYALRAEYGVLLAMRGSESGACASSLVDWSDNFAAPFFGSLQYRDVSHMVARYPDVPLLITGHSKGGHNALHALAAAQNPAAHAVVFNAQGFARSQLSPMQKRKLKERAANLVTGRDIVGALAFHPEKRTFCAFCPDHHPHSLDSFLWQADGSVQPGRRALFSRIAEFLSRLLIFGLHNLQSGATIPYQRKASRKNAVFFGE